MSIRVLVVAPLVLTLMLAGLGGGGSTASGIPAVTAGYVPMLANLLDTTRGVGAPLGAVAPHATLTLAVGGRAGVPGTGVTAVAITLIAVRDGCQSTSGWLTVYPSGSPRPPAANLDFRGCRTTSDSALVALGSNGSINVYNGSYGSEHVVVNLQGYYRSGTTVPGSFVPVPGHNLLNLIRPLSAAPHSTTEVPVAGRAGIPSTGVTAVAVTVLAAHATTGYGSYLTVYPSGAARPPAASVDLPAPADALAVVPLGSDGGISIYNGSRSDTELVVNVDGYFVGGTPADAGTFTPLPAANVYDQTDGGGSTPPRATESVTLGGLNGIPTSGVSAVVVTLIAMKPQAPGWATVSPFLRGRPRAASLEFDRLTAASPQKMPWAASNTMIAPVSPDGLMAVYNGANTSVAYLVNVSGYYSS